MSPVLAAFSAFIFTLLGGLFALRYRRYLNRILGFTGGVVLAVVAFDILPEIFELTQSSGNAIMPPMIALVVGYLLFHLAEKLLSSHHAHETHPEEHCDPRIGKLSAGALVAHSFLDGVGIGLAFQVSAEIGVAVALAVVAHDFSDGLNTVSLMLRHGNKDRASIYMLVAGAAAPVLGALSTLYFKLTPEQLTLYLGFFAGFLLYIGTSSILPAAHRDKFSWATFGLTVLGATFTYWVAQAHIS